ncbi:Putative pentatricopeptide repeat-containing protein At4g17915 [Linum grandiflorum]
MKSKGYTYDGFGYCTALGALIKVGKVEEAAMVKEEMIKNGIELDLVSYNTLMNLSCKQGKVEDGHNLIGRIEKSGLECDKYTHTIMVDGLCKAGDIEAALRHLKVMKRMGFDSTSAATNSVIDRLAKDGNYELAIKMFKSMEVRDAFTCSSLVYNLTMARRFDYASEVLLSCLKEGLKILPAAKQALLHGLQDAGFRADARILGEEIRSLDASARNSIP